MRPKKNIEKFVRVRKPYVTTSREMDKRTLNDSFAAMEQTIRVKSADHKPSTPRIITLSRMMKLTAAVAVIIMAISFFIAHQGPGEQADTTVSQVIKSPAEMLTATSLIIAFRRGGIEAIEKQCDKALEMQKPPLDKLDIKELFTEIEIDLERTEL
ncbi:MAG: hypothetical protein WAV28_15575 [Sedimentisphaerales bacterium]